MYCNNCRRKSKEADKYCYHCGTAFQKIECRNCKRLNDVEAKFCYFCGVRLKGHQGLVLKKSYLWVVAVAIILIIAITSVSGHISALINVYPVVSISEKHTTLSCDYAGQKITYDTSLYANINNYYHYNRKKNGLIEKGDFSKYIYANSADKSLHTIAEGIKSLGYSRGLNDDQVVELTTCFIQNIPYDEVRGKNVLENEGNKSGSEQFPYETLYLNRGICTDKTYLASALLKELGYSTAILVFPEDEHIGLGIKVPDAYADFGSGYAMQEVTTPGFAPGELPEGIDDNNGRPSATVNNLKDLNLTDNPTSYDFDASNVIDAPTYVIKASEGKEYTRIVAATNLANKLLDELDDLENKQTTLQLSYNELQRRDNYQEAMYSSYLSVSSQKYECGYKYDYSYSYSYFSPYSYTSPYRYTCDYVPNPQKNYAYSAYTAALGSYNNQVGYYNSLVKNFNNLLSQARSDLNAYRTYVYN